MSSWNQNIAPRDCGDISVPAFGSSHFGNSAGVAVHADAGFTTRERVIAVARPQTETGMNRTLTPGIQAWSPPT